MPCKQKQTQTTNRRDKDGDIITTHTSKRVCANDASKVEENEEAANEDEELDLLLVKPEEVEEQEQEQEALLTEEQVKKIFSRFMKTL